MTAANAFARQDAAWLIADTAGYNHDGRIVAFGSKISSRADLRVAIAHSGRCAIDAPEEKDGWLAAQTSQRAVLDGLPELLAMLSEHDAEAQANGAERIAGPIPAGLRLLIAWWDADAQRGRAATMTNVDASRMPAYTLRTLGTIFSPPIGADRWVAHTFDPEADARALADRQRAFRDDRGIIRVGGAFEAVRVHAGGIERREVTRWNDRLGRVIPTGDPRSILRRCKNFADDLAWTMKGKGRAWA